MTDPKLSKRTAESAQPAAKPYRIHDDHVRGLHLRVQPSGVKSYCVVYQRNQTKTLGKYPVLTLQRARELAKKVLADPAGAKSPKKAKADTLRAFLDDHYGPWVKAERKAGAATVANLKAQFADYLDKPLTSISAFGIERFKADRLRDDISPATVNRDLARLSGCLTKAIEWKMLTEHPVRGVKPAKGGDEHRIRYLNADEEKALRKALGEREKAHQKRRMSGNAWRTARGRDALPALPAYCDHLAPMTLVSLNTGLRRGELTSLTWADINLERKVLTVRAGYAKSGKARHIPLNSEAVDVLKRYKKQHEGEVRRRAELDRDRVPVSRQTDKSPPKPTSENALSGRLFAVQSIKKAWGALMADAKLQDFRWHDLRHTFASKLVMAGVDLNTVRELLGHADIRMTLRYAHLAPEHKAAAVEKLVGQRTPSGRA
jgi:integrase